MPEWTPLTVFLWTWACSALAGLGPLLLDTNKDLTGWGGVRLFAGTIIFYGFAGVVCGLFGFLYLGGKKEPWKTIACGMAIGIRALALSDISLVFRRVLGSAPNNKH